MARAKKEVEEKKVIIIPEPETVNPVISDDNFIDEAIIEEIQDTIPEPKKEVKKVEPEPRRKLRFQKIGGGSLRGIPGYPIIKPNQIFDAYLDDITQRFLPSLKCLDAELMAEQVGKRLTPAPKETIWRAVSKKVTVDKKSTIIWNVINGATEKATPINDLPLSEAEAIKLAEALNN
jgi:hypothetical protein